MAGLPASVILHAALFAWLVFVTIQHFDGAPMNEQSVEVELQTLQDFEAMSSPRAPAAPDIDRKQAAPQPSQVPGPTPEAPLAPPPVPVPNPVPTPVPTPAPEADGMVHPRRLLSQKVLADPRSRETRALLPRLAPSERVEQLCGLEAMVQIRDWQRDYEPDRVTADALAPTRLAQLVLTADGAAFRSKLHWYGLRFTCTVTPDLKRVTAFAFHVEDPVPQQRWEALGLPAIH